MREAATKIRELGSILDVCCDRGETGRDRQRIAPKPSKRSGSTS